MADASPNFHPPDLLSTATAAATTTTTTNDSHDGLVFWKYMLAGSLAGVVEHTAMFPIDTLKTQIQAQKGSFSSSSSLSLFSVFRSSSFLSLYRGLPAMALGAGPAHAVYFSVYERSKHFLLSTNPNPQNQAYNSIMHASSGVVATVASDAVFTPMDTVKQRLQLRGSPYKGLGDCVGRVFREEGVRAFYASYRTTVVMNAPFTAVHFATYEAAKMRMVGVEEEEEGLVVHATAGAVAGALAGVVTTPLDVVKTQLQCQGVCGCDRFTSTSIREVIQAIIRRDGYAGLMRGWKPRMLFHAPAAAICWSTYEASKTFFQGLKI